MVQGRPIVTFARDTSAREMLRKSADAPWQDVFPVLDAEGRMVGMITADALRIVASGESSSR